MIVLKRVDATAGINRWYMVSVQQTLLEPVAVVCAWGSRKSRWQQLRVLPVDTCEAATKLADKIVKNKQKRGYEIVRKTDGHSARCV